MKYKVTWIHGAGKWNPGDVVTAEEIEEFGGSVVQWLGLGLIVPEDSAVSVTQPAVGANPVESTVAPQEPVAAAVVPDETVEANPPWVSQQLDEG